jgi:hypothetical protein
MSVMLVEVSSTAHREKRRSPRHQIRTKLKVSWTDVDGRYHFLDAECLNASETGVRVLLPSRVDTNCYINVKSVLLGLNSSARVRNVTPRGIKFEVGLEFNGGWRWEKLQSLLSDNPGK